MPEDRSMEWVEYTRISDGDVRRDRERILADTELAIIVNREQLATSIITPALEKEFVTGHLYVQGIIDNAADIESITIKQSVAEVTLSRKGTRANSSPKIRSNFQVARGDIFAGVNAILKSDIYAETRAIHSAGLFKQGAEPICIVEDVGRHNALDKIIGYALINGIDLGNTFATSTGRMVFEMVSKICRAGIPIVATKTAVTKSGIQIGERCGLTIAGFVIDKGTKVTKGSDADARIATEREMKIYSNPERIL